MKDFSWLETNRTIMRKLTFRDAEDFYTLNLDQEVVRYTGDKPFESVEAAKDFLDAYGQYERFGVGRLAVVEKANLRFLGWCGLAYRPELDEYDIGFRFYRRYWNRGFATETAGKCLEFGFQELGIQKVVGRVMEKNGASIRVLEKIGMDFKDRCDFDGNPGLLYEILSNGLSGGKGTISPLKAAPSRFL